MNGRCCCGSIRYRLKSPPSEAYYCHCRDCQYIAGSPFMLLAIVERGSIEILQGETASFRQATEDGSEMTREFCPSCATPLFNTSTRFTDIQMISVNSLDDPEMIEPSFEIWTRSQCSAAHIKAGITSHLRGALDD